MLTNLLVVRTKFHRSIMTPKISSLHYQMCSFTNKVRKEHRVKNLKFSDLEGKCNNSSYRRDGGGRGGEWNIWEGPCLSPFPKLLLATPLLRRALTSCLMLATTIDSMAVIFSSNWRCVDAARSSRSKDSFIWEVRALSRRQILCLSSQSSSATNSQSMHQNLNKNVNRSTCERSRRFESPNVLCRALL